MIPLCRYKRVAENFRTGLTQSESKTSEMMDDMGLSCSPDGSNRPSHKQVEQYRRMKAKEYFEDLRDLLPSSRDTRCDRNRILQEAIEYVKELQGLIAPRDRSGCDDEDDLQFDFDEDKKDEDTKHLSHNQVEQRRRQLAKSHFEDLRNLLSDAGKFDKNTILLHTIQLIRKLTGKEEKISTSSPSPTNECLSRSAPASWLSQRSTVNESSFCGLSGLSLVASSMSSGSDLSDLLLSSSCPEGREGRGRKRSPQTSLFPGDDDGYERKRRVSDVLEEEAPCVKEEVDRSSRPRTEEESYEEMLAFNALTLLSECAERLTIQSAQNTPASTPKIAPQAAAAGEHAFEVMSLTALCS